MPINAKYVEEVLNRFFGGDGHTFIVTPKDPPDRTTDTEKTAPQKPTQSDSK